MRRVFGFMAGLICGALVGVATGLLLAPYAGSELRERIRMGNEEIARCLAGEVAAEEKLEAPVGAGVGRP